MYVYVVYVYVYECAYVRDMFLCVGVCANAHNCMLFSLHKPTFLSENYYFHQVHIAEIAHCRTRDS